MWGEFARPLTQKRVSSLEFSAATLASHSKPSQRNYAVDRLWAHAVYRSAKTKKDLQKTISSLEEAANATRTFMPVQQTQRTPVYAAVRASTQAYSRKCGWVIHDFSRTEQANGYVDALLCREYFTHNSRLKKKAQTNANIAIKRQETITFLDTYITQQQRTTQLIEEIHSFSEMVNALASTSHTLAAIGFATLSVYSFFTGKRLI